jgi:exosortase
VNRSTLKNAALALGLGLLVGVSPLTPPHLLPALGLGACAALAFFVYRLRVTRGASDVYRDGRRRIEALRLREVPPGAWVAAFLFTVIFAPTLAWMYTQWTGSVWRNNHGIFMPVLMFFLARSALRREESVEDDASAWGFAFVVVGLALAVLDATIRTRYLAAVGFVVCLPGFSLLFFGRRRTVALRFALLLGIFMIPVPITLANHIFLRNATAAGAEPLIRMLGIAVARDHSVLDVAGSPSPFVVSEACSGFATLYSALALTIFLVAYCRSPLRRVALLLSFFPLALAANVLRVLILVLMGVVLDMSLLDTVLHEGSGVATFFLVVAVLVWMSDRAALREAFA